MAFYTQPHGTPNWWLDHHGVTEDHDVGDGVPAWQKYVMDTDPNVAGDYLKITGVTSAAGTTVVGFSPASTRRYYTLAWLDDLAVGGWTNVAGQAGVPGTGGSQTLRHTNAVPWACYRVEVSVRP